MSIQVVFSSVLGTGHNLISMIRQDHPGSSQRQTEPVVGKHHKLIPIKKVDRQDTEDAVTSLRLTIFCAMDLSVI